MCKQADIVSRQKHLRQHKHVAFQSACSLGCLSHCRKIGLLVGARGAPLVNRYSPHASLIQCPLPFDRLHFE